MTTDYSAQSLTDTVTMEFSFLCCHGFSDPLRIIQNSATTLCWKHWKIAIEAGIDWREMELFILIVRLENGALPLGYYVSHGKPCRFHLQKVITENNWPVDKLMFQALFPTKVEAKARQQPSVERFQERIRLYKHLLQICLDLILKEQDRIFS